MSTPQRINNPTPLSRRSFFATPQAFQQGRNNLRKATASMTTTTTTRSITTTQTTTTTTQIVDGHQVTETTKLTVTEPTLPKGLRGKLIKTLIPGKKVTHQVVTRHSIPMAATLVPPTPTGAESESPAHPANQRRGVRRASTPMPVTHGGSMKNFFAPAKPITTASTLIGLVTEAPQENKPPPDSSTSSSFPKKQQRGVRRTSTPMPIPQKGSVQAFFNPSSKPQPKGSLLDDGVEGPQPKLSSVDEDKTEAVPNKLQRGVRRTSTPMPVSQRDPLQAFFGPVSKPKPMGCLLDDIVEGPQPKPSSMEGTTESSPPKKQQRGVQRTSTPMPVSRRESSQAFFGPVSKPKPMECLLDEIVEGPQPKAMDPTKSPPKRPQRGVRRTSTPMPVRRESSSQAASGGPEKLQLTPAETILASVVEGPEPMPQARETSPKKLRGVQRTSTPMPVRRGGSSFDNPGQLVSPPLAQPLLNCVMEGPESIPPSKTVNDAAKTSPKKQRGVTRTSTPIPVPRRSEKLVLPPAQPHLNCAMEGPQPMPSSLTVHEAKTSRKKDRGVRRSSTPLPVRHWEPTKNFCVSPPTTSTKASTTPLIRIVESPGNCKSLALDASTTTNERKTTERQQRGLSRVLTPGSTGGCNKSFFPPRSPLSVVDPINVDPTSQEALIMGTDGQSKASAPLNRKPHPPKMKVSTATVAASGIPSMFAHSFPKAPSRRFKASKHAGTPTTLVFPAPLKPAELWLNETTDGVVSEYDEFTVLDDGGVFEYEEFTILDDDNIYECTYFEEETVLDDSQRPKQNPHQISATPTANPGSIPGPGQVKLEGMELLVANIHTNRQSFQ